MKIAILTLFDSYASNFGNKLQNYAAEKVYSSLGYEVQTLVRDNPVTAYERIKNRVKQLINFVSGYRLSAGQNDWRRFDAFWSFNDRRLHIRYLTDSEDLRMTEYDYYSVGSDQVWNPLWLKTKDDERWFLLENVPESKRLCMSASFGVEKIPEDKKDVFIEALNGFGSISVREDTGRLIVKDLINREAEVLVDPTLAIDKSEWEMIEKRPKRFSDEAYILCYFLGGIAQEDWTSMVRFAEINHCKIYDIMDHKSDLFGIGPEEFLWLIHHSSCVLTDSFHGCVFSIIYGKSFFAFKRKGRNDYMFSRIETLLGKFNLLDRVVDNSIDIISKDLATEYDVSNKLLLERDKFWDYFKKQLGK